MRKAGLAALMESVTVQDLKGLISLKGKMEELEKKKKGLERDLAEVEKQMKALEKSVEKIGLKGRAVKTPSKRKKVGGRRKRVRQPSLSSLVAEVLRERKKPMKIADICRAVLEDKKYRTRAKDFKSQLRILLYKNEKRLFKKTGPGTFALAGGNTQKAKK